MEKIIGRGTWIDKTAHELLEREKALGRKLDPIRTESGLGASGFPHVGSLGDAVRAYGVKLAVDQFGARSEYIAFSDDMDGLRKIPAGLPDSLKSYLGFPVTGIPDPFKCHESYGEHMTSLLLDALDACSIQYTFQSARDVYRKGLLNKEIEDLLLNAKRVGEIIREELGQEKYVEKLPYFPICGECGRIYTTQAYDFLLKEKKVLYKCEGLEIQGKWLEGCNHQDEVDYREGGGKLSWVGGEFAARWRAFKVSFEAFGKDIADSVRVNDRICKEVLGFDPPMHTRYEMFLDKSGRKISKSAGNVFTPQVWLRYGSPQSLLLLLFKRFVGTRNLDVSDVPRYMSEFDDLEDIYFGRKKVDDQRELAKLRGLYEYCRLMRPPAKPEEHTPYNLLVYAAKIAPKEKREDFIIEQLRRYSYAKGGITGELKRRIEYAANWADDFEEITEVAVTLDKEARRAVEEVVALVNSEGTEEGLQNGIYAIARKHRILPRDFFRILYRILLGSDVGPRLGPYMAAVGKANVVQALERALSTQRS